MKTFDDYLDEIIRTEIQPREKAYGVKISQQLIKTLVALHHEGFITREQLKVYLINAIKSKHFVT
jgi:hypothetical protein